MGNRAGNVEVKVGGEAPEVEHPCGVPFFHDANIDRDFPVPKPKKGRFPDRKPPQRNLKRAMGAGFGEKSQ